MDGLGLLGPADPGAAGLRALVAAQLGADDVELLSCAAEEVAYDQPALTTAERFWVRGSARSASGTAPYAFFV